MIPARKLQEILDRFAFIEAKMIEVSDPAEIARLGRDYSGLQPVVATIRDWQQAQADLAAAREILDDPDMRGLAEDEITAIEARLPALEELLRLALLPRDAADERAAILEIRPGPGGDEAALFPGALWRRSPRLVAARRRKVQTLHAGTAVLVAQLSRSMRQAEFLHATVRQGRMSFRVRLPLSYAKHERIPAADGQMGCIMKMYRDWQLCGDDDWLRKLWPKVKKALQFAWIEGGWDADRDGVINNGATKLMLIVGDFDNYVIADRVGMSVELIPHLFATGNNRPSGQRGLFAFYRVGADSVNDGGFAILDVT